MIKQNIKIALLCIFGFIIFWLIMFCFIKIDVSTSGLISFEDATSYISIETKASAYIINHDFDRIKIEYKKQYFSCPITFVRSGEIHDDYFIVLPEIVVTTETYILTNVIIDSLNVYEYLIKK